MLSSFVADICMFATFSVHWQHAVLATYTCCQKALSFSIAFARLLIGFLVLIRLPLELLQFSLICWAALLPKFVRSNVDHDSVRHTHTNTHVYSCTHVANVLFAFRSGFIHTLQRIL